MPFPSNSEGLVTREILLGFVEQIEGVFAEIDELGESKKAVYGAAHDAGIEKTALGKVVAYRRQRSKSPAKFEQQDALVQKYLGLIDGTVGELEPHARIRAREVAEQMRTRTEFFERIAHERAEGNPRRGENSVVYFLHAEDAGTIKIGVTGDIDRRLGDLMRMSPLALKLLLTIPGNHKTEGELHERFKALRLHGEWFSTEDGSILDFVASYVPDHDPETGEILDTNPATPGGPKAEEAPSPQASSADNSRPDGTTGATSAIVATTSLPAEGDEARQINAGGENVDHAAHNAGEADAASPVPAKRQWKHTDKPHADCLNPSQCGGFSNLGLCPGCKEAAAQGQVA